MEQTRVRVVQLKDEMTTDSKINQQGHTNAETEEMSVLTKTVEEKTVRQTSSVVDVEEMKSERYETESTLLADGELAYKMDGESTTQASE